MPNIARHNYRHSTWKTEDQELKVILGYLVKFETSLKYMRPSLNNKILSYRSLKGRFLIPI